MKRFLPLFLVAAGVAAPASAQIVDRVIGYTTPGQVYVNYGYGSFDKVYNSDGDEVNNANALAGAGTTVLQRAALGGSYNVAQAGNIGIFVGAEVAMASSKFDPDAGSTSFDSGFKTQMVGVGVGVRGTAYGFGVAYQRDLGNKTGLAVNATGIPTSFTPSNSDGSDALLLGAEVYTPFSGVTITAGANYYLTLKQDQEGTITTPSGSATLTKSVDPADYLDVHIGGAYRVADVVEMGVQARYLKRLEGEAYGSPSAGNVVVEADGYAISLVPYLTLSPEFVPAQITLSASATREYTPYGYPRIHALRLHACGQGSSGGPLRLHRGSALRFLSASPIIPTDRAALGFVPRAARPFRTVGAAAVSLTYLAASFLAPSMPQRQALRFPPSLLSAFL